VILIINLWLQAIAELEEQEGKITSGSFDRKLEREDIAFSLYNHLASSEESAEGSWLGPVSKKSQTLMKIKIYLFGSYLRFKSRF